MECGYLKLSTNLIPKKIKQDERINELFIPPLKIRANFYSETTLYIKQ